MKTIVSSSLAMSAPLPASRASVNTNHLVRMRDGAGREEDSGKTMKKSPKTIESVGNHWDQLKN